MFYIELVWNREFKWVQYGEPHKTKEEAIEYGKVLLDMGDGTRVKQVRISDVDGNIVVQRV